jgi:hypothetical protein
MSKGSGRSNNMLDYIFDDKRVAITIVMVWMTLTCILLAQFLDVSSSSFMTFGPSSHSKFMTIAIDTWPKWGLIAAATFTNSCVNDFMTDAIIPWLQNTLQDHKAKHLPYSKCTCYVISQLWNIYSTFMSVFSVALVVSQIDLLLIKVGSDLCVNTYTCFKFMRNKIVDRRRYWMWFDANAADGFVSNPPRNLPECASPMLVVEPNGI